MIDIKNLVRKNIIELMPYSSARDEYTDIGGVLLDANENPFGDQNRYPDPYQKELKNRIAIKKNINTENIFVGNGSDEAIDLCFRIFCEPRKDKGLQFNPTYGMYKVCADINDIEMESVDMNAQFQIPINSLKVKLQDPDIKVVFICSPNNPSGNNINTEDIEHILKTFKGIVVLDEAYVDFSDRASFLTKINQFNNLIVLQTFSKAMSNAGIRVGMAFADKEIINLFNKVKPPYNVSSINQIAAINALDRQEEINDNVAVIKAEKEKLIKAFQKLTNVETVYPSDANFLLVRFSNHREVFQHLLSKKIVVRDRSTLVDSALRITIGTPEENNALLKELKR